MFNLARVKTKSGRVALTFTAYSGKSGKNEEFLLWWHETDQEMVLSPQYQRIAEVIDYIFSLTAKPR
jgi:hypothetical protein